MPVEVLKIMENDGSVAQDLRAWVKDQLEEKGVAITTLATTAGVNRSLLSRFINHGECNDSMVERLKALRERMEGEPGDDASMMDTAVNREFKREIGLMYTEDFQQAVGICSMCHRDGEIGVIIGHAGSGKTTALKEFSKDRPDVLYVRAKVTMTVKGLLQAIGEGLGLDGISGSKEKMVDQIIAALRENPVMLIIDEADLLVDKFSVTRLETIRAIWDETHTGLVICGMPKLAKFLVKGPGGGENLAQIYSRVRRAYRMKGVSREELLQILSGFNITEQARKYLLSRGASIAHGGLRRFTRLLQNALDLVKDDEAITLEIIKEADGLLVTPEALGLGI